MNTSDAREQRANEEIDLQLEYERVTKQRYEDFQEWLNKCPLVVTAVSYTHLTLPTILRV